MRRLMKSLTGVVVLIILAWLAIWFYTEMRLKQLVEAHIAQINSLNAGEISFDRLTTNNSPWVASVALINPEITIKPAESSQPLSIRMAKIGAHINLFHPLTLHIDFPLSLTFSQHGETGVLTFANANIKETLNPSIWLGKTLNPALNSAAEFTGINLLASGGSLELATIDHLTLHQATPSYASKDQIALKLIANLQGFHLSPLFTHLLGVPFDGEIKNLSSSLTLSGPFNTEQIAKQELSITGSEQRQEFIMQQLYQWAKAGGHAQGSIGLQIGPSQMQTNFILAFDKDVQPLGRVTITASQIDQFSTALSTAYPSLKNAINAAENALSSYSSSADQNGQTLNINATYNQSGVYVNGKKTGTQPYLNWNILLSSAALPATAPGDGSGADQH